MTSHADHCFLSGPTGYVLVMPAFDGDGWDVECYRYRDGDPMQAELVGIGGGANEALAQVAARGLAQLLLGYPG